MNERDRYILYGALCGTAVGGLSGYLLARHIHRARADAEIADVREHFRTRTEDLERRADDAEIEQSSAMAAEYRRGILGEDGTDPSDFLPAIAFEFRGDGDNSDRAAIAKEPDGVSDDPDIDPTLGLEPEDYVDGSPESLGVDGNGHGIEDIHGADADESEDDDDDQVGSSDPDAPDPRGLGGPYIITEEEFSETKLNFQKLSIKYYTGGKDKVLCDDKDAEIPNITWTVGANTLDQFGIDQNGPHILYVRNEKIEVDFEICLDYNSYTEKVLGYIPPRPKPRTVTRHEA